MKGHAGAVITSGLLGLALLLAALLQLALLSHGRASPTVTASTGPPGPSHRFSAPGGRAAIPWAPSEPTHAPAVRPGDPPRKPAPARERSTPPATGPRRARRATA